MYYLFFLQNEWFLHLILSEELDEGLFEAPPHPLKIKVEMSAK